MSYQHDAPLGAQHVVHSWAGQSQAALGRSPSGPKEVEALCGLMHKYGLSKLTAGDVTLERPHFAVPLPEEAKKPGDEPEELDPLERLKTMSPEAQDAALRLAPTRP